MKSYLQWRARKVSLRAWRAFCSKVYRDEYHEFGRTSLVAGVARSGTTWIGDIIASQAPSRIMFEPFYPQLVEPYEAFNNYQYMRPDGDNPALNDYCAQLFSGQIRHPWIDHQVAHPKPQYRMLKAVRANLMLMWLSRQFADVCQILVIRHPCAVVLSWMQLGWDADGDIQPFLEQPELVEDFLSDKMDIIQQAESEEEKLGVVWCIGNLVPLSQFRPGEIHITFYEHMCTQPEIEIPALFQAIGRDYHDSVFDAVARPSTTSRPHSAAVTGKDRVTRWQKKLSSKQVDRILSVVEAFGLNYLYSDSANPIADRQPPIRERFSQADP
jgi:hypothetical protein